MQLKPLSCRAFGPALVYPHLHPLGAAAGTVAEAAAGAVGEEVSSAPQFMSMHPRRIVRDLGLKAGAVMARREIAS